MIRHATEVRADIEQAVRDRSRVLRDLEGYADPLLVERHSDLEARLRFLWAELREVRCKRDAFGDGWIPANTGLVAA